MILLIEWSLNFEWLFFIVIALTVMCEGAMSPILPPVTIAKFGHKRGQEVYAYMYSS